MTTAAPRPDRALAADANPAAEDEHRVTPLELFFDLVFVLAITQVTQFFADHLSARGVTEGLVLLALLWWSWVGYSWLTNSVDTEDTRTRLSFFVTMAAFAIVAITIPQAYGEDAVLFAVAYFVTRVMQVGLYAYGTDPDDPNHGAILRLAPGLLLGASLLVVGALVGGEAQLWIWLVALVIDVGTPYVRGAAGFQVHAGHFAERHGLIVIIALGESIVALGAGAAGDVPDVDLVLAAILGVAAAAALWWAYFDIVALVAEHRMTQARGAERALLARDSYSYIHFLMIAGIVLLALGIKKTLGEEQETLKTIPAIALCAGPALYLLGHIAFRLRNVGTWNRQRLVAALLLLALIPVAREATALVSLALVTAVLVGVMVYEEVRFGEHKRLWRERLAAAER